MNVLLVSDFYPPQVGGMEQHVAGLARELQRQQHQVVVATTAGEDIEEVFDGVPVARLSGMAQRLRFAFSDSRRRYPPPIIDPLLTRKLRRLIVRCQPDVIHAHGWTAYSAIAANRTAAIPLVVTLHDYGHFCPKRTLLHEGGLCELGRGLRCLGCAAREFGAVKAGLTYLGTGAGLRQFEGADEIIAVSSYVRDRSEPYLNRSDIHVLPNFLDPERFLQERDPAFREQLPERFIAYVGVLAPFKGVDDLIAAFQRVKQQEGLAGMHLIVLGREHPGSRYEDDAAHDIHILRNPQRGLVVEAFHEAECVVVPSRCGESCPTTVLEGVCAGTPVIGTRVGGIPELLESIPTGHVVPAGDPKGLAEVLLHVCLGRECRDREQAIQKPHDFLPLQPGAVTERLVQIYDAAGARRRGRWASRTA